MRKDICPSFWASTFLLRHARPALRSSKEVDGWFSRRNHSGLNLGEERSPEHPGNISSSSSSITRRLCEGEKKGEWVEEEGRKAVREEGEWRNDGKVFHMLCFTVDNLHICLSLPLCVVRQCYYYFNWRTCAIFNTYLIFHTSIHSPLKFSAHPYIRTANTHSWPSTDRPRGSSCRAEAGDMGRFLPKAMLRNMVSSTHTADSFSGPIVSW